MTSSRFGIVMCAETLVSARKHAAELIIPGFGRPTLSLRDVRPVPGVWRYILEMGLLHLDKEILNAPVERYFLFGCVARGRIFTYLVCTGIPLRMTGSLTAYCQVCLRFCKLIERLCSPLLVILTVTMRNGYTRLALMLMVQLLGTSVIWLTVSSL